MHVSQRKLRIIVGGMVGQFPIGGPAWDYLQYPMALAELGHEVYYHEDTWVWPLHPIKGYPDEPGYTIRFFREFFQRHAPHLAENWCYVFLHEHYHGMSKQRFDEVCRTADLYLNVSGACFLPETLGPNCRKVFLDTDPGYNQVVMATRPDWVQYVDRWVEQVTNDYDAHLTYAEHIHADDCRVPTLGLDWKTTRPVVSLDPWDELRKTPPPGSAPFTTVMTWKYYSGLLSWDGLTLEQKAPEFEKFKTLPSSTKAQLELAIGGEKYDPRLFHELGWQFCRALPVSLTPDGYRDYLAVSAGEWSVAKNVYVALKTGWFSCRTACYLAAGRPAVVQDTGWSEHLPSGDGCLAFRTLDEAVAALDAVSADPAKHQAAAYDFAREYLAPDRVLPPMLDAILS